MPPRIKQKVEQGALVSPEERDRVIASVRGQKEQSPSTRQQSAIYENWRAMAKSLGDPYDVERIPIPYLKRMRRDPMLGFGLNFIKTPLVRAPWSIEATDVNGPNAQVAAFIDRALRNIYARLIFQYTRSLDFGFTAIVKRFATEPIPGNYQARNPETGVIEEAPIWSEGSIDPIVWKPFVPLPPEDIEPIWKEATGEFDGIKYIPSNQVQAKGSQRKTEYEIDVFHCSPPDEPVLTSNRGYVPIGDLTDEDLLVVWDKKQKKLYRKKGFAFETARRQFSGELLTVSTERASTRVTPNHKFTVRWAKKAQKKWAVYLMKKGDWWRIGITPLIKNTEKKASGIGQRVSTEGAEAAWILELFDSKNEALFHEKLWQSRYGVPGLRFRATSQGRSENCLTTKQMEQIWAGIDSESGALHLLQDKQLDIDYPFFTPAENGKKVARGMRGWTCPAVNLVPELMEIPVDPGESNVADWLPISKIVAEHYEGEVVSIDVPPHHHYVSNGVVTQNSLWATNEKDSVDGNIFGYPRLGYAYQYWFSSWHRHGLADRHFEKDADPATIVRHPIGDFVDEDTETVINNADIALDIGDRVRSGSTVALPSDVYTSYDDRPSNAHQWDIDTMDPKGNFDAFLESDRHLNVMKLRSLWIPEQALIEGEGGQSSRNVASTFGSSFEESQAVLMAEIDDHINRYVIPQLVVVNFPEFEGEVKKITKGFASDDIDTLRQVVQLVGQQDITKLGVNIEEALERLGIPVLSPQEQERQRQQMIQESIASQPPAVAPGPNNVGVVPTGGENAGPAGNPSSPFQQTGFAMQYMQPRERLHIPASVVYLSDDFLDKLPDSPHYKDKEIRKTAKAIHDIWRDVYVEWYDQMADHVSKADFTGVELSAAIELADNESRARKIAETLVGGFNFVNDKVETAANKTVELIRKAMKRSGDVALKESKIKTDAWDIDADHVTEWLDTHMAETFTSIAQTTRDQLTDFLAKQYLDGDADPSEVGKLLREHFAEFPDWRADELARTEVRDVYNAATLYAGQLAGVKQVQAFDALKGPTDPHCEERDGEIYDIDAAFKEREHPNGTLGFKLLPVGASLQLEPVVSFSDDVPSNAVIHFSDGKLYIKSDLDRRQRSQALRAVVEKMIEASV